jgi:hypothetical protein
VWRPLPLLTGLLLAICGTAVAATPQPLPTAPGYGTYSVLDIGKGGIPQLTAHQRAWLQLIHDDPTYRSRWRHLRFAPRVAEDHLPVVVFDADPETQGHVFSLAYDQFLIIGDACNAAFDPSEGGINALPHFDMPCKPSEQLRVRGEKKFLGWEP